MYLPGRGLEPGETPDDAAARETLEECGLVVRPGAWRAHAVQLVYSAPERTHFAKPSTFVEAALVARAAPRVDADHALAWVDAAAAPALLAHRSHAWAVERWATRAAGG